MSQLRLGLLLVAGAIASFFGLGTLTEPVADMRIEPTSGVHSVDETFTVNVVVEATEPVNVFKGDLRFDPNILSVDSIDYNTSIADLWAEKPWYSNGEGTLNFIGGTTKAGGFTGAGALLTITFRTEAPGRAVVSMENVRILRYDGLGSDTPVATPLDAIFTVDDEELAKQTVLETAGSWSEVDVVSEATPTDLNSDGKQSIADVSIFMGHMLTQNPRSDFDGNGRVGTADLSILLSAK